MNKELLGETVKESGLRTSFIAQQMHMSIPVWFGRLRGRSEFKVGEAIRLKNILNLSEEQFEAIFFD